MNMFEILWEYPSILNDRIERSNSRLHYYVLEI